MQVSGGALEELERIRKVLEYFEHVKIHIGIGGEPGANAFQKGVKDSPVDLITYARVHEYGAVIKAIHHKNLTIPIHKDAKDKRIKDFQGIFFIKSRNGFLFACVYADKKASVKERKVSEAEQAEDSSEQQTRKNKKKSKKVYKKKAQRKIKYLFLLIPEVTIPERSFIRASYDKYKDKFVLECEDAFMSALQGIITPQEAANRIGVAGVTMIHNYIEEGTFKAKSSITLSSRPDKTTPLIDSGRLVGSIAYQVEGEEWVFPYHKSQGR